MSLWTSVLNLFKKHKHNPPSSITNLKAILHMSTATLTWTNPTTRKDGSPLLPTDISHVEVFDTTTSGLTSFGFATSPFTTPTLTVGNHAFNVTTTDVAGQTSDMSNTVKVTVLAPDVAPAAVTNLVAVLNV
jgi:hypothetical protein